MGKRIERKGLRVVIVDVEGDELVVTLRGSDRALAGRRCVQVPLVAISGVAPAPELIDARPIGMKLPGSFVPGWPGPIFAGTFVERGGRRERSFWSLRRATADQILQVDVADVPGAGPFRTLVLQVPDAETTARKIHYRTPRRDELAGT